MERAEIQTSVYSLLKKFTRKLPSGFVIDDSLSLTKDLNIDSADLVDLVLQMEETFDVVVPDSALNELKTVGDVVALLDKRLSTAG